MELINATKMVAGYTMGMDPDGREYLVVVVKGTFDIPETGEEPKLSAEQLSLIEADTFTGEPGFSAPIYESDYCLTKPKCDVIVNGSAYAPGGKPATKIKVGFLVGSLSKIIEVVGDRNWSRSGGLPDYPQPFTVMPITYDRAFGGTDESNSDKAKAYDLNPVGVGYRPMMGRDELSLHPVPNTQEPGKNITSSRGKYKPMSFGPIGRSWPPRLGYAGTYDDQWLENEFPFLPADFDNRYFQFAPEDQQIPYPNGGEKIILMNLNAKGHTEFRLPSNHMPIQIYLKNCEVHNLQAVIDTIVFSPNEGVFNIVWRVSLPLKQNMFEILQVRIGEESKDHRRVREVGKPDYSTTQELEDRNENNSILGQPL